MEDLASQTLLSPSMPVATQQTLADFINAWGFNQFNPPATPAWDKLTCVPHPSRNLMEPLLHHWRLPNAKQPDKAVTPSDSSPNNQANLLELSRSVREKFPLPAALLAALVSFQTEDNGRNHTDRELEEIPSVTSANSPPVSPKTCGIFPVTGSGDAVGSAVLEYQSKMSESHAKLAALLTPLPAAKERDATNYLFRLQELAGLCGVRPEISMQECATLRPETLRIYCQRWGDFVAWLYHADNSDKLDVAKKHGVIQDEWIECHAAEATVAGHKAALRARKSSVRRLAVLIRLEAVARQDDEEAAAAFNKRSKNSLSEQLSLPSSHQPPPLPPQSTSCKSQDGQRVNRTHNTHSAQDSIAIHSVLEKQPKAEVEIKGGSLMRSLFACQLPLPHLSPGSENATTVAQHPSKRLCTDRTVKKLSRMSVKTPLSFCEADCC